MVVIHSRRAFSNIVTLDYAIFTTFLWATNLYFNRIIFAYDFKELFLAVKKPHQWQTLRYQADELNRVLSLMKDYQLMWVSVEENRGAACNKTRKIPFLCANGHPAWLFELFVNESRTLWSILRWWWCLRKNWVFIGVHI